MRTTDESRGSERRGPGPLKLALFALLPVTLLLAVGETAAAVTIHRWARWVDVDSARGTREYRTRIGRWPWSHTTVTPINTDGFPDAEFPDSAAPKTCRRVMMLGDSFILGDMVDGDSSFVSIVEREAGGRAGAPCVTFFNLGERGTTIPRQLRRARQYRERLRPDVVLLGMYQNDLTDLPLREPRDGNLAYLRTAHAADRAAAESAAVRGEPPPRHPEDSSVDMGDRFTLLSPRIARFLSYHVFAALITSGIHRDELRRWSVLADSTRRDEAARLMAQYAAHFDSLATELAADSIPFGVIILPSKFDLMAGRYPEEAFFLGLAERHGVPALRILPVLDARRRPYPFLMYDGHLSPAGNRAVADTLAAWLFAQSPAPFPALREPLPR